MPHHCCYCFHFGFAFSLKSAGTQRANFKLLQLLTLLSLSSHVITMIALRPLFSRQTASTAYKLSSSLPKRPSVVIHARDVHIEKRIEELKIELPTAPLPKANYNIVCMSGDTLYVSGHLPITVSSFIAYISLTFH